MLDGMIAIKDGVPVFTLWQNVTTEANAIPEYVFAIYQCMFAMITVALISGALAERIKFSAYCLFVLLWTTLVYDPLAHWVWMVDGWLFKKGALDFAGGTVVHLSSGISALAALIFLGKRHGFPTERMAPHSLPLTLIGVGLLWFGWFGFNAGSAVVGVNNVDAAGGLAGLAFTTTTIAPAAAGLSWMIAEWIHGGKPSALGFGSGVVAGLVVITPAAGFVQPGAAIIMGLIGGVVCYGGVLLKARAGYDDALDAFGVHGIGGATGALLVGGPVLRAPHEQTRRGGVGRRGDGVREPTETGRRQDAGAHAELIAGRLADAGEHRAAAGEPETRLQPVRGAGRVDLPGHVIEELGRAGFDDLRDVSARDRAGALLADGGDLDDLVRVDVQRQGRPLFHLERLGDVRGDPQHEAEIAGDAPGAHGDRRAVADRAVLEDGHVGGVAADVAERHPELTVLLRQQRLRRRERRQDELVDLDAGALHAL
jgi:hypothetical protein